MGWIVYLITGAALLMGVLSVALFRQRARLEDARSLAETLVGCRALLGLILHFQQHRGMSSAWLAGDLSFASKLAGQARDIDALFHAVGPVARSESCRHHPCMTPNALTLFRHRWATLRERLPGLTVEQSITQHTTLIEQLLQWLAALGEARIESTLDQEVSRCLARNYTSRLPALTECLGQARAVGMSVATRQSCSAVARVRLVFLIARAETLLTQALAGGQGSVRAETASRAVEQMAQLVRGRLLPSSGVSVTAQDYFNGATQAVDAVFAWIFESAQAVANSELQTRRDIVPLAMAGQ